MHRETTVGLLEATRKRGDLFRLHALLAMIGIAQNFEGIPALDRRVVHIIRRRAEAQHIAIAALEVRADGVSHRGAGPGEVERRESCFPFDQTTRPSTEKM